MSGSGSWFVRQVPRRPLRFLQLPLPEARLVRKGHRPPIRPARFPVGLDLEEADPVRLPKRVTDRLESAPVKPAFYLGRVEEVDSEGELTVRMWEWPSGRETLASLSADEHLEGPRPRPGDLLHVWTWIELPGSGEVDRRVAVQLEKPRLEEQEREALRRLLDSLGEGT